MKKTKRSKYDSLPPETEEGVEIAEPEEVEAMIEKAHREANING